MHFLATCDSPFRSGISHPRRFTSLRPITPKQKARQIPARNRAVPFGECRFPQTGVSRHTSSLALGHKPPTAVHLSQPDYAKAKSAANSGTKSGGTLRRVPFPVNGNPSAHFLAYARAQNRLRRFTSLRPISPSKRSCPFWQLLLLGGIGRSRTAVLRTNRKTFYILSLNLISCRYYGKAQNIDRKPLNPDFMPRSKHKTGTPPK